MSAEKETAMTPSTTVVATSTAQSQPTTADARSHWAAPGPVKKMDLEAKFEAMRSRNWITERMVEQYQKHWHCTREQALERLLAKSGA